MRINRKSILLIAVLYLAFLALTVSVSYFWDRATKGSFPAFADRSTSLYMLPPVTVNLASRGSKAHTARMSIGLEVKNDQLPRVEGYAPRIIDRIQTTMGRVSLDEVRDRKNLLWLSRTLLWEVNQVSGPVKILDVLFREIVVT